MGASVALIQALLGTASGVAAEPIRNGFDLAEADVPASEIHAGGPPRDGIPALDQPETGPADSSGEAAWADDVVVLGFEWGGEARAYPLPILDHHELVNDTLGGRPVLISWCPLCGTGMVFDRRVAGVERHFGVSGLLYQSDVLMYDRETESLWSQISSRAITGMSRGNELTLLRSRMESWGAWRQRHPGTTVLSRRTGHRRDYGRSPYRGYSTSSRLMFPVPSDDRYHPKMPTLGLRIPDTTARGYPAAELVRAGGYVEEELAGEKVRIRYDDVAQVFDVVASERVEVVEGFWFAWAAFHPDASLFRVAPEAGRSGPQPDRPAGRGRVQQGTLAIPAVTNSYSHESEPTSPHPGESGDR
ncbi:MAG: DUF3179 domain-containing protein [bacterium]|nr:DUF3179 domain-containing protein [bacterium]